MSGVPQYRRPVIDKVPVLVVIDDGYFGHEALENELGPRFEVRFASDPAAVHAALGELTCPLVLAPRTLDPTPGDLLLADLARRSAAFIGMLLLDRGGEDGSLHAGDGIHAIVRRPLAAGELRLHAEAAAGLRARLLTAERDAARLAGDFARLRDGLRHDLRGHLQTIVGLASLLLEIERPRRVPQGQDDELFDFLTRILAAGERLTCFVDLLGDWLNAARRPLELAPVDVGELVLEVVARSRTANAGVATTLTPPDPAGLGARIEADARLLQRALEVLVARAQSVGKAAGKPAQVMLASTPTGWIISVSDVLTRVLPPAQRAKAFDLFEKVAGDGLELALVHKVAERHGASVTLQPIADGGNAVLLTWPLPGLVG
jgi:signal transduction histidine kinase